MRDEDSGMCGDPAPAIMGAASQVCTSRHGHTGWHSDDKGMSWSHSGMQAELVRLRAAVAAVTKLCDDQAEWCSSERVDTPSWVTTVRAALAGVEQEAEKP